MTYKAGDLVDLVSNVFEVDSYQSKMGDDDDIVVVSFSVNENQAAKDLVDFIEKGYSFVLDADATTGEVDKGVYKVFVEIERNRHISENIMDLLDGVGKISNINEFKFRYHKSFRSRVADIENLSEAVPIDPQSYRLSITESNIDNYKLFFNKSYLEGIESVGDNLILKKSFADPVGLRLKDFGEKQEMLESIEEKINVNDFAEILFLTKYIGDYNVTKFGNKTLTLENNGHLLIVERI